MIRLNPLEKGVNTTKNFFLKIVKWYLYFKKNVVVFN